MADPAEIFAEMAARLARIDASEFAGAAVIVPRDGDPIVFLLQDPNPKSAQFWVGLQGRVEIAAAEAKASDEGNVRAGYGMRR